MTSLEGSDSIYYHFYNKNTNIFNWSSEIKKALLVLSQSSTTIVLSESNQTLVDEYELTLVGSHSSSYSYNLTSTGSIKLIVPTSGSGGGSFRNVNYNPNSFNVFRIKKAKFSEVEGSGSNNFYFVSSVDNYMYSYRLPTFMSRYWSNANITITLHSGSNLIPQSNEDWDLIVSLYSHTAAITTPTGFTQSLYNNNGFIYWGIYTKFYKSGNSFPTSATAGANGFHYHFKNWNFDYHSMSFTGSAVNTTGNSGFHYLNVGNCCINSYIPDVTSSYVITTFHENNYLGGQDYVWWTYRPSYSGLGPIDPVLMGVFSGSTSGSLLSLLHGYYTMSNVPAIGASADFDSGNLMSIETATTWIRIDNKIKM